MSKINSIDDHAREGWISLIERKVNGLRFGAVQVTIHEGKVTQVEVTEKTRFQQERVQGFTPSPWK